MLGLTTRARRVQGWLPAWRCFSIHFQQQRMCREGKFPTVLQSRTHSSVQVHPQHSDTSVVSLRCSYGLVNNQPGDLTSGWGEGAIPVMVTSEPRRRCRRGGDAGEGHSKAGRGCLCQTVSRRGCVSRVS